MIASLRARARDLAYRHIGGTAVVLIYHRVANLERDPQALAVSTANFDAQMAFLSENYRVVSTATLARGLKARHVPNRAVAVTFDDGYADNLRNAGPSLVRHEVPATVYVCSGYVGGVREFWWDEIERLVLAAGTLPRHLRITADTAKFTFDLGDFAAYDSEQARSDALWTVLADPTNPRQRLYAQLCAFVQPLALYDREVVLSQLREAAGFTPEPREINRQLANEEVLELDHMPGIRVGGHTKTHQVLSARSSDEQRVEIDRDRDALAQMCERVPESFSYPYGGPDHYTNETVRIVREAGYTHACANRPGVVKPWLDEYRIPRNLVRNWTVDVFADRLKSWFNEPR